MKSKIKILHVVGRMNPGGIETLLMNLYRNFDREQFEFHFAVQTEADGFYDNEIIALGGRILKHPSPREGLRLYRNSLIKTILLNGPYTAIHSHVFGFSGYIMKIAKNLGIQIRISHSHNTSDSQRKSYIRMLYRFYMRRLINKHATHLLGCSKDACKALFGLKCFDDKRVNLFPNAIQLNRYATLENQKELKRSFGVSEEAILIGHIGRFNLQKNHKFILYIFSEFVKKHPNSILFLIGDGPLRKEIEIKARELGIMQSLKFMGLRKDIPEILGALDVFILPSLYEGLGIVLIEAQAAGVPCLISDVVPDEADVGLDLITRLSIKENTVDWTKELEKIITEGNNKINWEVRVKALAKHGYDIRASSEKLMKIYKS